jgi:hypothetical protein
MDLPYSFKKIGDLHAGHEETIQADVTAAGGGLVDCVNPWVAIWFQAHALLLNDVTWG